MSSPGRVGREGKSPGSKPWEAPVFKELTEKEEIEESGLSRGKNEEGVVSSDKVEEVSEKRPFMGKIVEYYSTVKKKGNLTHNTYPGKYYAK